ncbi:MAG: Eco57I restriction-modification methylase domain-containing protein [Candidatus Lokiarchaeota archaeon]|nr:Eco57I restriction-modification methylase domain-containing protein [Candidatus Lokiarchaeota archaeon]
MASETINYNTISKEEIFSIFQNAILEGVKKEHHQKIKIGKPIKSNYLIIESDPEAYTRSKIEPYLRKFLPKVDFHSEIHKKTSLGNLKKPDGFIPSQDVKNTKNLLIEWEPFNEDLRIKKDHGINQAKIWISDINIGYQNSALVSNGKEWVFITTKKMLDEIRVIEQDLTVKEALELIENVYNGEKIQEKPQEEAIDITEKFYNWYVALIHGGEYIDKENERKIIVKEECLINNVLNASTKKEKEDFIRINFTRLIFIRILTEYGIIRNDTLNDLKNTEPENFYSRINQLYFESLNTPLKERENIPKSYYNIPFLNGDLFRIKPIDRKGLRIRRESFIKAIQFLRTFHFKKEYEDIQNNFKIDNTIDPEILGHVLEKTIDDRKQSGVYYTPQVITEFMSEEVIKNYIKKRLIEFLKEKKDLQWKYIEKFEDIYDIQKIILKKFFVKIIKKIKICDPAVGSGAFLLSCGNLLFQIRKKIMEKLDILKNDYIIKKEIIQDNLYGVDIKEAAVDICKLRLWLWIIQKQEPEPLPNIDFNIRKGNSLIGYTNTETIKIDIEDISTWIKKADLTEIFMERNKFIRDYYTIKDPSEQKKLKDKVDVITNDFNNKLNEAIKNDLSKEKINIKSSDISDLNFFHWIMEFSEVFERNDGFDIIIGNPPYFRVTSAPKFEQKLIGKLGILKKYHHGQGDIYYDFIVRCFELLKEGGDFIFITSRYWLESAYANYLKSFLKDKVNLIKIIDFRENLIFKGVDIHNSILNYTKEKPTDLNKEFEAYTFRENLTHSINTPKMIEYLEDLGNFNIKEWNANENWAFVSKTHNELFLKIKRIKTKLGDDYNCNQYTNSFRKKHKPILIFENKPSALPEEFLRSYRKMGEVKSFIVKPLLNKYVIVIHNRENAWNNKKLNKYFLSNDISKSDLFEIKKNSDKNIDKYDEVIYIGYRIPRLFFNFTYVDDNTWVDNTYFITKMKATAFSLKYLIGILNSELMKYYIDIVGKKKEVEIEIGSTFLKNLPIIQRRGSLKSDKLALVEKVEKLVIKIIEFERNNRNISQQLNELNKIIYNLYEINEKEQKLIKNYLFNTSQKLYEEI